MFIEFILEKSKIIGPLIIIGGLLIAAFGKSRWQYYPVYLLFILYIILIMINNSKPLELNTSMVRWVLGIGIFLIATTIIFLLVLPKEKLSIPSGQFRVGTRIYELEDETRNEIYSEKKNDKRKIKYQVWYPAEKTEGYKKAKWIDEGVILTRQLARSMHMPFFMLDHTAVISSNSYFDAPINNTLDTYPVVIISHGWRGFRSLHTDYAEELASNGFIVISIDHTYGSEAVKFEDGSLAYLNEEALSSLAKPSKYDKDSTILVTTYGKDVASVIDDLEKLNSTNPDLKGKLDLESIGLLGHSTGGGGDVYISLKDKGIKALLGLDAWVKPIESELEQGLSIPSLFLRSGEWSEGPNNSALYLLINNSENATLIQMNETTHVDFTRAYMYSPILKYVGFTGKSGGREALGIQKEFILNFFDKNLKNYDKDENYLLGIVDKYDNIELVNVH
ncbi:MAG: dienelactone hydrolase family protein [Gudongella sp.]|nr:dienelactone hydrolase family protein [Gudongella sp.]